MTAGSALRQGQALLEGGGVAEARLTAEVLLCHALRRERVYLYSHPEHELSTVEWLHYGRYLHERLKGKPTQYITRRQEFFGREFVVSAEVLIPRPETEHVVERAAAVAREARRVLDIGTGSGALAVTLALEQGRELVVATDISAGALRVARENARRLGALVRLVRTDLAAGLGGAFDLIVSNPPYIPESEIAHLQHEVRDWEPRVALAGGADGAEPYRRIVPEAERLLRPGGWLIFEIGFQIEAAVRAAFGPRWRDIETGCDLAGLPRVISGRYAP
ncbi:MAG TPA: peptide chain release factor N(5)-glutamine methyltransferase [Bryobacteraceae bacterium]|nr:peptide chain release factor N(5)-glutamine methyltransferase [Bryobacterales bacterium]HRJ17598.1 peptide chain release factor N(5)-glutamine methyltransferase [Bryobacteraceae bacterium]